jgi:hypothetical protein
VEGARSTPEHIYICWPRGSEAEIHEPYAILNEYSASD